MDKSRESLRKVAIIGAGPMGLATAYELLKSGYAVNVYERDDRIGGMSASFDFSGLEIEKYYHFVCGPDYSLFDFMKELNILDKLKWTETKMGFYYDGTLYKWGNPIYLLQFDKVSLLSRLRYGLHLFQASKRKKWGDLDKKTAISWLKDKVGEEGYKVFWHTLFESKFYEYQNEPSAAWLWTRLKRVARSRKNIFTEKMGYIEGGSDTLLVALKARIEAMGGEIHLNSPVESVRTEHGRVTGIVIKGNFQAYDSVISTIPLPYIPDIVDSLPDNVLEKTKAVNNVGVVCIILKMKESLTENFWLNINDKRMDIPGMIEYSNLNPLGDKILYVPFYLHKANPTYSDSDESFTNKVFSYARMVNPYFTKGWVMDSRVFRYEYAQPVCTVNYNQKLPPIETGVEGLYILDTSHYYPEDRSISESVKMGKKVAAMMCGHNE